MKEPVRILSDLHLGHAASRLESVEFLRPLIAGMGTVVFNGDTCEELVAAWRDRAATQTAELRELCRSEGVVPVFLSGNHDPGWSGPGWVELADGRIVVTHGDAFLWSGSPWSREVFERAAELQRLWAARQSASHDATERLVLAREIARALLTTYAPPGRSLLQRVLDAGRPPRRALEILRVWLQHPTAAAAFARRYFPAAEVVVAGHFHWPGQWWRDRRLILNTGAFVPPHPAWWVDWHHGWLRCGPIQPGPPCRPGQVAGAWRFA